MKDHWFLRGTVCIVTAFLTALFLFAAGVCLTAACITDTWYLPHMVDVSGFAEKDVPLLEEDLNAIAIPSGLGETFFTGKVQADDLRPLTAARIAAGRRSGAFAPDTAALHDKWAAAFREYADSVSLPATDEAINSLADLCVEEYKKHAAPEMLGLLAEYSARFSRYVLIGGAGLLLVALLLLLFQLRFRNAFYPAVSLGAGGLMLLGIPLVLLLGRYVERIGISSAAMRGLIAAYVNGTLRICIAAGAVLFIGSLIWGLLGRLPGKKEEGKHGE